MSNFDFIPPEFAEIADSAQLAERQIMGDPRAACFHARFALENIMHWMYRHDPGLNQQYDSKLATLLYASVMQNLLPQPVFQKARLIHKQGNKAVHRKTPVRQYDALQVVKELYHVCYWLVKTYTPGAPADVADWRDDLVPKPVAAEKVVPRATLAALEKKLSEQKEAALKVQQEKDEQDAELQALKLQLAEIRAASEEQPDPHDYSEAETRKYLIDVDLQRAGWTLKGKNDLEYELTGMPNNQGKGYADYVLWGDDGKPLAVVEAKKATVDPEVGKQQAKLYADCLERMHGQRPVIFYTNGYVTWLWDDVNYPPRAVAGFYKKDELARLILRRSQRQALDVASVKDSIVNRYYQKRAIGSIFEQLKVSRRKALLVMATGTGKTRTAIALVDVLQRAGWVKRALFLADRISLVKQAANAFKTHLPESSPVNLVTEKATEGRVYVSTYPTMMNLIDESAGGEARFGVGHFDLVIIDEAHRSVYQKYGAIFKYFDSLLVGLTATPREEVDKNTYDLFELEPGVPTDAYELTTAVADEFLVPPKVQQVDLSFPRRGISYDQLSNEEKEQWESLDWGDHVEEGYVSKKVRSPAVNNWLFNKDTVDKALKHLMEHGHKVDGGDRLAKTIIFARNHDHAVFIEKRFNHHYPHYAGHFARIIDNYAKYPQSLLDDFSIKNKAPHIAISVDMLDTGVDVPEVLNLVFFKPIYSRIKFWQMIGRGTRLCPDLFGPGMDKENFRVFDFCFNFDFFNENPDGIEGDSTAPLGTRLFQSRVQLIGHIQARAQLDPDGTLGASLADGLHARVKAMNPENFIVRMHLEAVETFKNRDAWNKLSESDRHQLQREVADLPSEITDDEIEARQFDLLALRMQLAVAEGNLNGLESLRKRVMDIAMLLEDKTTIPAVAAEIEYLKAIQEPAFWLGMTLVTLENMRLRIRDLVSFIDRKKKQVVYTDFEDKILDVHEQDVVHIPKMTGAQYEKKVKDYLTKHSNEITIHRLRTNQPLTELDLQGLEKTLTAIGEEDGEVLLKTLMAKSGAPSLAYFVRSMVGMDREAVQAAFSTFLTDRSFSTQQIRFVELIINQLTARGIMEASALYEPPFSNLHSGGPDGLFAGEKDSIDGIFKQLKMLNSRLFEETG